MRLATRIANRTPFYYGWIVLFSAGSSQFVRNAAASLTLAVFIYPLSQELGWSRTLIAGSASAGGLLASGASPGVGWLVDRFGARVVLATSVFVLGLSTMSLAWATAPIAFYIAYGVGRVIFSSTVQIGSSVVVARWFIRMRGRAAGLLSMSHSLGMTLFPLLASLIILYRDFQTAWIVPGPAGMGDRATACDPVDRRDPGVDRPEAPTEMAPPAAWGTRAEVIWMLESRSGRLPTRCAHRRSGSSPWVSVYSSSFNRAPTYTWWPTCVTRAWVRRFRPLQSASSLS